jgi:chromosome segregation ATPase
MIGEKQQKIDDLKEIEKIIRCQLYHYAFILEHIDEELAKFDKEVETLKEQRECVWQRFVEAPEQLIKLKAQLEDIRSKQQKMKTTKQDSAKKTQRIKDHIVKLRKRLSQLEGEGAG